MQFSTARRWETYFIVRTHRDIIFIAQHLKADSSREEVRDVLSSKLSDPRPANENELIESSIDLAARLMLMMEFGGHQYGFSGHKKLILEKWLSPRICQRVSEIFL
jgi:hypothetical protein